MKKYSLSIMLGIVLATISACTTKTTVTKSNETYSDPVAGTTTTTTEHKTVEKY